MPTSNPFEEPSRYLLESDPNDVATKAGVKYEEGRFYIDFMEWEIQLTYPGLQFHLPEEINTFTIKLLTLLYLSRATGVPLANQWVPYRELKDGLFYARSFNKTVEQKIETLFGSDPEALRLAGARLGSREVEQGDVGLVLRTYPRISLLIILWVGDEEFPASASILFDANATDYLNVFELRMLAGEVVNRLSKYAG